MATRNWTGAAQDGNFGTAGNWDTAPVDGDSIVIATGDRDINAGLTSGLNFVNVTITEGFRFNIGGAADALSVEGISGTLKVVVAGQFVKILCTGGTGPIVACTVVFKSRGLFSFSSGTMTTLHASGAGTVDISASAVVTNMRNNGPIVTAAAGTAFTIFNIGAGQLTTSRSIGTFIGSQSKLITLSAAAISTAATVGNGCIFNHQASGTIASLETMQGSTFTPSGNTNAGFTVTALYRHTNSQVDREYGGVAYTITAEYPI